MRKLMIAGVLAGLISLMAMPAHAADQSGQVCAGTSSVSSGTWTFTAGTFRVDVNLGVSTDATHCSFSTSYPLDPEAQGQNFSGLVNSTLALQGSGDFSCANGGNGTLSSPPLDRFSQSNHVEPGTLGSGGTSVVVWTASFSGGVGQLTGTLYLYGAQPPADDPQPVRGTITVDCADPSGGAALNTDSVLTMPRMPSKDGGTAPSGGFSGSTLYGCVATAGYSCRFEGHPSGAINGIVSATTGSWSIASKCLSSCEDTTVVLSGTGPAAFPYPFQEFVTYTLTVGADGEGVVTAGSPN